MKRKISAFLAVLMAASILSTSFTGCEKNKMSGEEPEVITRPLAEDTVRDVSGMSAVPKPEQETSKTIQWIDMDDYGNADLMMMTTLQGNVNRVQPSMYIIHDEMVEGSADLNGSAFWFEQLDTLYTGAEAFEKVEYQDPYEMLVQNKDKIKGAVIYHERLCDGAMASRNNYQSRYGDMALLNLTLMMCSEYEAVALNYIQYTTLKEDYGLELEILGDTTKFMEKDADGSFSAERGSREVWARVYKYALATFGDTMNKEALGHNAGFQAGAFDYYVANRIFIYNRIFSEEATEEERNLELSILNVSKPNTPVFGCWYLQADEGTLVPILTENYKYVIVSYESFNVSWTSGLPYEELEVEEEKLTLDPTKKYVAFTFTEGDNNSYLQFRMPTMFQSPSKGKYSIGWTIAPTCWDLNPNIIRYYSQNWSAGDGLAIPEAGVDYVYHTPPEGSQDEYFAISDEYFARVGSGYMRTLQPDVVDPLPYAEKMKNLDAIVCGYLETGNTNYNNDLSHFLFRDTPVFLHYNGKEAVNMIQADCGAPGFYAVSLYGWSQDPSSVEAIMESLGDDYVAVTPKQLADLYRQYYGSEFENVTQASFQSGMTRSEMGFLYKATDYSDYDSFAGSRIADAEDYFIYSFDLAEGVKQALFDVIVKGDYQIEASTDYLHWTVMARGTSEEKKNVSFDASSLLEDGKTLYIRFGDRTPKNTDGVELYALYLNTDKAALTSVDILGTQDRAYLVDDSESKADDAKAKSEVTEEGRQGEFIYCLPLSATVTSGDLMIAAESVSAWISTDNKSYTELPIHKVGGTWYGQLEKLTGKLYLKLSSDGPVSKVRFNPTPDAVDQLSFSPVSNPDTRKYLLSLDEDKVTEVTYTSSREVTGDNVMVYRFVTAADVTEAKLMLTTSGLYQVSVSNDGENYKELFAAASGENPPNPNTLDITDYAAGGKTVYVKFGMSVQLAGKSAKLVKFRLLTNKTSDTLLNKLDMERTPDATLRSGSEGEEALLYKPLSKEYFLYESTARCMTASPEASIVYRYDTNSDDFYKALGIERTEVNKLRISLLIANAYKVSVSADGKNWTEVADSNDASVQSASNQRNLSVVLTDMMSDGVVYVRISRSDAYEAGRTHDGLIYQTQFYFN